MSNLVIGLKSLSHRITVPSLDPVAYPSLLPCIVNTAPYNETTKETNSDLPYILFFASKCSMHQQIFYDYSSGFKTRRRSPEFRQLHDDMSRVTLVIAIISCLTTPTYHSHLLFPSLTPTLKHFETPVTVKLRAKI